jgi:hypothetical protein
MEAEHRHDLVLLVKRWGASIDRNPCMIGLMAAEPVEAVHRRQVLVAITEMARAQVKNGDGCPSMPVAAGGWPAATSLAVRWEPLDRRFIRCEKPRRHVIHEGSLVRKMPSGFVKGGSHWRKNCIEFNAIFDSMQSSTSDQGLECLR